MTPLVDTIGLALVHFVWQGAAIASGLWVALRLTAGAGPRARYAAACIALAAMVAAPVATAISIAGRAPAEDVDGAMAHAGAVAAPRNLVGGSVASSATPRSTAETSDTTTRGWLLPALVAAWAIGVLVLGARLAGGAVRARRLTRTGVAPADRTWEEAVARLARSMGVRRRVRLLVSSVVGSPATLGWVRPVVLVPASVFVGLTPRQLEAILAHEVAHVCRHDFLVNLLQLTAETLLFYHPAVWWTSRIIARERELICDDMAVGACGNALVYARALAQLERMRAPSPRLALAAGGGELYERVVRLVESAEEPTRRPGLSTALAAVAACALALPGVQLLRGGDDMSAAAPTRAGATVALDAPTTVRDARAQAAAEAAMRGRRGAAVVLDARTGQVMAIVNEEWAARREWPAASTFKLVTALAAVTEGAIDPDERVRVADAGEPLDLEAALARSSNDYFTRVGSKVGTTALAGYADLLGLGKSTSKWVPEREGRLPAGDADAGALGGTGDGVLVTPLQLARVAGAIASDGASIWVRDARPARAISPEAFHRVRAGMLACTEGGTAAGAFGPGSGVAAKTATGRAPGEEVGLFAGFAPAGDPRWVVVVALDEPGVYGADAARVAADILRGVGWN